MAEEKKLDLNKIDKNMAVSSTIGEDDVVFYDVREEPFAVYGLYDYKNQPDFKRLPDEIGKNTNSGVATLYLHTAGGRVRFSTDSQYVAIRAEMPFIYRASHFPLTGSAGLDLFVDDPITGESSFYLPYRPDIDISGGYESKIKFPTCKLRHFTIHFPSYSMVKNLWIGLQKDATVGEGAKYRDVPPIVYYGSSITQGACASRPGNIYQNIIARRLNIDYINLGFSGNGRAEDIIANYMAGLSMSAFVSDYDHNAPNAEHLENTHLKLYQTIREKNPDIPYIMISKVDFDKGMRANIGRREVIHDTYRYAIDHGDQNVYFIDGEQVFAGPYRDLCVVDGTHPTDIGFALMADAIGDMLKKAFVRKLLD